MSEMGIIGSGNGLYGTKSLPKSTLDFFWNGTLLKFEARKNSSQNALENGICKMVAILSKPQYNN